MDDVDSEDLPFEDSTFDVVVFSEVMGICVSTKNVEISRVLIKDGRVVGSVPNAFRLRNRVKFFLENPSRQMPLTYDHTPT